MKNALNTFGNTILLPVGKIAILIIAILVWISVLIICALQTFETFRRIENLIRGMKNGTNIEKPTYEWFKVAVRLVFFPFVIIILVLVPIFGYGLFELTPILYALIGVIVTVSVALYFGYRLLQSGKDFVKEFKEKNFVTALFYLMPICAWIIIIICAFAVSVEVFF